MFTHSHILSRTIQIIGNHARTTVAKDSTISGLSIDSLSSVEIVMELEEEFQIDLNEKVAATFRDSTPFAIATAIILEAVAAEIETGVRDTPNEIEESGDLEFYHEGYRQACGFSREEAIAANIEKLGKRYLGHKYTDAQAIARADKSSDSHESPRAFEPQSSADADSRDIFNR